MMKTTKNLKSDNNGNSTMANDSPLKTNQLYHILQPSSDDGIISRHNKTLIITLMLMSGILWMQIVRMYSSFDDLQLFLYTVCEIIIGQINMYKAYLIIMNKDRLWNLLDVTQSRFTTCSTRDSFRLHQSKKSLTFWLKVSTILGLIMAIVWILAPCFVKNIAFNKLDGNLGYYKANVLNNWYPISESIYNRLPIWFLFYVIEAFLFLVSLSIILIFDCYLATICVLLKAHFDTMSAAYETLGNRPPSWPSSDTSGILVEIEDTESYYYDELILYIKDNMNLMKILEEFYDIIRPAVIIQITIGSASSVIFLFSVLLTFVLGYSIMSFMFMKYVTAYLMFKSQLFIYCYIFHLVDTAKSMLNPGLYGSNWTEMNLKFQKTLLMTMYMNSAHKRQMKVSPKLIVNLEFFMAVMKLAYTIVSVLLKISSEKEDSA